MILGLAVLAAAGVSRGDEAPREAFVLMIEPKLMAPGVSREIPGAKATVLAAGRETEFGGLRYYDREEFASLGLTWESFRARALESAERTMAALEPEYVRDERGVIEYAVLRSRSQRTAGVVLSAAFRRIFRKTLGDELVVIVPDRFTVFVYPKLAGGYAEAGPAVIAGYDEAVYPVSTELFLLDAEGGILGIGEFSRGEAAVP